MTLILAGIAVSAFACQWLAWRVKLPAILFLLLSGIMLGPVTELLNPDDLFGDVLFPLVSLAVAIILFEGTLTLNFAEIKNQRKVVRRLILVGGVITWAVAAVTVYFLFALPWDLSVLFGAITVVTGPTVIVPMGSISVTVWRELRRRREPLEDWEPDGAEAIRKAADRGDWETFVQLMGGAFVKREEQTLRALHMVADKPGRYGEVVKKILGLVMRGASREIRTRFHEWRIVPRRIVPREQRGDQVAGVGPPPLDLCQ